MAGVADCSTVDACDSGTKRPLVLPVIRDETSATLPSRGEIQLVETRLVASHLPWRAWRLAVSCHDQQLNPAVCANDVRDTTQVLLGLLAG
jgi:hypothetical protein